MKDLINIISAPNKEIIQIITAAMNRDEKTLDRESLIALPSHLIFCFNYRVIPQNLQLLLVWHCSSLVLKTAVRFGGLASKF